MSIQRLLCIALIFICTSFAWGILGTSLTIRSAGSSSELGRDVEGSWGPVMTQKHPAVYYDVPGGSSGRRFIQPSKSDVTVSLQYDPKKKGLLWYRTYKVEFHGNYTVQNPTPIAQTIYIAFTFPAQAASYTDFSFKIDGAATDAGSKTVDGIVEAVTLQPGASSNVAVTYSSRGMDSWCYTFSDATHVRNFNLTMQTDFPEIDFPADTGSPTSRQRLAHGWELLWSYPDVIHAQSIGMDMPAVLNPGPVASRISYFSPVSLLFFFTVLVIVCSLQGVNLHPMNYFFLAAGCFAFQLLFAYLVDLIPLLPAFGIAAAVSLLLVSGYLFAAAGWRLARIAAAAQFAYMVLFSYSFFFDGLTGLVIAIGAIVTLALLMAVTARVNWTEKFASIPSLRSTPPPLR